MAYVFFSVDRLEGAVRAHVQITGVDVGVS